MTERKSVLAVDDEPHMLDFYRQFLGRKFNVSTAVSATQATEVLSSDEKFDLVICDGLNNAFQAVVDVALAAGIEKAAIVIVSGTESLKGIVEAQNIKFLLKGHFSIHDLINN